VIVNNVKDLESALYHYAVKSHLLEELERGDFSRSIARAALGQEMFLGAAAIFVWTAISDRSKWKYRQRAYRYVYLDAGHIAQNLALTATSIGLGSCQVGAFYDDEVNRIVGVDGTEESTIYLSVVGYPQ
jgi:SagB-type dehydrogenase family enzyme